jgi:hypothetical protein
MKEVKSILEFDGGSIKQKLDYELAAVMDNIRDVNTDDKPRELTIKIKLKPDEKRRTVIMTSEVQKKLRHTRPTSTTMQLSMVDGEIVGTEVADFADGQIDLTGEVKQTKIIKFTKQA